MNIDVQQSIVSKYYSLEDLVLTQTDNSQDMGKRKGKGVEILRKNRGRKEVSFYMLKLCYINSV